MRCYRLMIAMGCFLLANTAAWGQDPGTPLVAPPPAVVGAPVAATPSVWGSICASCAAKKQAICNGPLGQLLKNALMPLSALTGGLVPGQVGPSAQDLAAGGSVGAAAKIQADQKAAAKRRDAVRFLGTIDCHWYPEAEAGLVAALRIDRSECVRFEAARSLARGCCCTKTTIEALSICVSGSDRDGNPSENSLRVQLMALEALQRCVGSYNGEPGDAALPRPEHPASAQEMTPNPGLPQIKFTAYYEKVRAASRDEVLANAGRVIAQASQRKVAVPNQPRRIASVYEIWQQAEK